MTTPMTKLFSDSAVAAADAVAHEHGEANRLIAASHAERPVVQTRGSPRSAVPAQRMMHHGSLPW